MHTDAPIGVFDSGVGGLGTLKELMRQLPGEDFLYYGDNANAPYGNRSEADIRVLSTRCVEFLLNRNAKCIVVACNTASSASITSLRARYSVPFVAMEPAVRPAAHLVKEGKVMVLATRATLRQKLFRMRVEECGIQQRVLPVGCPELVELVEQGVCSGPQIDAVLRQKFEPIQQEQVDVAVLGCTHFLHLKAPIAHMVHYFWPQAPVIDGDAGTAHQLQHVLQTQGLLRPRTSGGQVTYFTSGDAAVYLPLFQRLMRQS